MASIDSDDWYTLTPDVWVQLVGQTYPEDFESLVVRAIVLDGPATPVFGVDLNTAGIYSILNNREISFTSQEVSDALVMLRQRAVYYRTVGPNRAQYIKAENQVPPLSEGGAGFGDAVANTVVPVVRQGPQGEPGADGAAGPQGEQGLPGEDVQLSDTAPMNVGVTNAGVSGAAARGDHVHAHGNQAGGSLHAVATGATAGFMSATDKTKLDAIDPGATSNTPADAAPPDVAAVSAVGTSTDYAREDHSHGHGAQLGGTLHAEATGALAGFMSASDKTRLDGITAADAAPPDVAASGSIGTGTEYARENHTHGHGNQAGGALHADATTSVAGFMSAADKTKLDGIDTGAVADHGALTGLSDDDHTQYARTDGTRDITGSQNFDANVVLNSTNPVLQIGDGSGEGELVFYNNFTAASDIRFTVSGSNRWAIRGFENSDSSFRLGRSDGGGGFQGWSIIVAQSDGSMTLEAGLTLDSPSPDLVIGDGTGTSDLTLRKDTTGGGNINFQTNTGSGLNSHWIFQFDVNEDLSVLRRNASGGAVDVPLRLYWSTGDVELDNNLRVDGTVKVGDASGNSQVFMDKANASNAEIYWRTDSGAGLNAHWITIMDSSENLQFLRRNNDGTANDAPFIMRYSTGNVEIANELHVGTDGSLSTAPVQVVGTNGMLVLGDSETTATSKGARLGGLHYTNGEQPVGIAYVASLSSVSSLHIGGGSSTLNAATSIDFYTAANTTTTTGTSRMTIASGGDISMTENLSVAGQSRGGVYTATVSGTGVTCDFNNGNTIAFDTQPATGNVTVTMSNCEDGGKYWIRHEQGATTRTLTFSHSGLTIKWSASDPESTGGGTQPGAIGFENRFDIYEFHRIGSLLHARLIWRDELTPG
jgi:hypothetical protein